MGKRALFYGVIGLQVFFLLAMSVSYYAIDWFGQEIRLKTEPVDPRDIFYGDYVTLHYTISTIPKELWKDSEEPSYKEPVYVVIREEGGYFEAVSVNRNRPEINDNEVLMKGRYLYDLNESELFIEYGIERYFVQEGTGMELEEQADRMEAYIKIAPWGQMKITNVQLIEEN
ncbi:GDYXXLXY domain-containing protein [Bacillus pinisoli]|uniref:GDYXXLXY domain-containing protein n=1 Tax=Bacillus pinisoli TaxID=2901866 RepID=UPI001FF44DE3|nr:GDYXXLXY domain-containing protein [Bacillus pinisoli]